MKNTEISEKPVKIAIVSLGHPDFSAGGAETAAYNLFKAYRQQPGISEAVFLARIDRAGDHPTGAISFYRDNEFLWDQGMHDWFNLRGRNREATVARLPEWFGFMRPDIVHVHHYAHMGLEIFRVIRQALPEARIYLTLHEYMAICLHNGQMVKHGSHKLCNESSLEACHKCFPAYSKEDLWLRKQALLEHFALIDGFIAPSEFLRTRYVAWGIPADRIVTIENAQVDWPDVPARPLAESETRNRFGFFGQINPYKGVDVLMKAFELATRDDRNPLFLEINGANLEGQVPEFRDRINELRETLEERGVLQWMGPYEPKDLPGRMKSIDWVVVPSIWWENSPMVIQEAFAFGRPVICSNIGGMAEKVRDGVNGLHFEAGNINSLNLQIASAGLGNDRWDALRNGLLSGQRANIGNEHVSFFDRSCRRTEI